VPQTICLNMIVKNEARVIRRCLDTVRPFIDRWVIVDTGSTDGTQALIREVLQGVPGELHERRWKDFAHNRNEDANRFHHPRGTPASLISRPGWRKNPAASSRMVPAGAREHPRPTMRLGFRATEGHQAGRDIRDIRIQHPTASV